MKYFHKRFRRFRKKKTEALIVIVCLVALVLFVGIKTVQHRTPEEVKYPSLVLQAMRGGSCVGDVWGLDIFLARRNAELLAQPFSKEKCLIAGLFAETVLRTASWECPLNDLKYAFFILREEKTRRLSETTLFLIRAKEWWRNLWIKDEPFSPKEAFILKALREEERKLSPSEMEKRYREMSWKEESEDMKAKFLIREAHLDQEGLLPGFKKNMEELKRYERKGILPFSSVLAMQAMEKRPLFQSGLLDLDKKQYLLIERDIVLRDYQKALARLSSGDAKGFVDEAEALARENERKEFAPILLYQAWSVSKYGLNDPLRAEGLLAMLKKKYPVSDWAYPEKAPKELSGKPCQRQKRSGGFGRFLLPLNILRKPAQRASAEMLLKIKEISKELAPGSTREIVMDEKALQDYLGGFFSAEAQKSLRGYQVYLSEQGVRVFFGLKVGFLNIVFRGQGVIDAGGPETLEPLTLKLQEIRLQGIAVPRAFLRQIEDDFREKSEQEELFLKLIETRYWRGGVKIVFRKTMPNSEISQSNEILRKQSEGISINA